MSFVAALLFISSALAGSPSTSGAPLAIPAGMSCSASIDEQIGVMERMDRLSSERQPMDEMETHGPLPVLDVPLVVRELEVLPVIRHLDGHWTISHEPVFFDDITEDTCLGLQIAKHIRRTGGLSMSVSVQVDPSAPTSEVAQMMELLESCGVDEVDFVVERLHQPEGLMSPPNAYEAERLDHLSTMMWTPRGADLSSFSPLYELLEDCPLDPSFNTVRKTEQAAAMRRLARKSLTQCGCAVDPKIYSWVYRLKFMPARFTNVVPVELPVQLSGATWEDAIRELVKR